MIKSIHLKNFKSFPDLEIPLKELTVLSGLNNCGKSSVIQSLRMYDRALNNKNPYLEGYGSLKELRSKFSNPNSIVSFELNFSDNSSDKLCLHEIESNQKMPNRGPLTSFISADRLGPQTFLHLSNSYGLPEIGDRGEYVYEFIDKLALSIVPDTILHESSEGSNLPLAIEGWLSEISPNVDFNYKLNSLIDVSQATFDEFRPRNVGFGISNALPIISAILGLVAEPPSTGWEQDWGDLWDSKRKNNTLIIIENPETHLHPKGQTAIGILLAIAATHGVQVIVETHSDHLMDGIRLACKQKQINSTEVIFHYLTKENQKLKTELQTPKMDENGKLDFWPNGFFDQSMKIRAKLARK